MKPGSPVRSANYVGRVGVLAVALGVGGVIIGWPATAAADTGSDSSAVGHADSTGPADRSAQPSDASPHSRERSRTREPRAAPDAEAESGSARTGARPAAAATQRRIDTARQSDGPPTAVTPVAPVLSLTYAAETPAPILPAGEPALAEPAAAVPAATATTTSATPTIAAPVAAADPLHDAVAATPLALENAVGNGGGDPSAPAALPLMWAAVGVSRRQARSTVTAFATERTVVRGIGRGGATGRIPPMVLTGGDALQAVPRAASVVDDLWNWIVNAVDSVSQFIENATQAVWNTALTTFNSFQNFFVNGGIAVADVTTWLWDQLVAPLRNSVDGFITTYLVPWVPVIVQAAPIVVSAVGNWVFNGTIATQVDQLVNNSVVLDTISREVARNLSADIPSEVRTAIGDIVAGFVRDAFGGSGNAAVRASFDTLILNLPSLPRFSVSGAWGVVQVLYNMLFQGYTFGNLLEDQVSTPIENAISVFLGDPTVHAALNSATSTAISRLTASPTVTAYIGGQVGQALSGVLPAGGSAVGAAVTGLLRSSGGALATAIGTSMATFLSQPGANVAVGTIVANLPRSWFSAPQAPVPSIQNAAGVTAATLVGSLLSDAGLVSALGSELAGAIAAVAGDPAVRALLGGQVAGAVVSVLGDGPAADGVAGALTGPLANLLADPAVRSGVGGAVGSAVSSFLRQPGVSAVLSSVAGQLASSVVAGANLNAAIPGVVQNLLGNSAIRSAIGTTVDGAVRSLVSDVNLVAAVGSNVAGAISALAADPAVEALIGDQIAALLGSVLGDDPAAGAVAVALADAVTGLLGEPAVSRGLGVVVDVALSGFLGRPGVPAALGGLAGRLATAALAGAQPADLLAGALQTLQSDPAVVAALSATATIALDRVAAVLLGDPAVYSALADTVTGLLTSLAADPGVRALIGEQLSRLVASALDGGPASQLLAASAIRSAAVQLVTAALGPSPATASIGAAVADAVVGLLASPTIGAGIGSVAGTAVSALLAQPGIATALTGALDEIITSVLAGDTLQTALDGALQSLQRNATIPAALRATVSATLDMLNTALLENPAVHLEFGTATTTLVASLTEDPAVVAFLADQLGTTLGPAVVALLADPVAGQRLATVAGTAVTNLLGSDGFGTLVTGVADQVLADVLAGADTADALSDALQSLQAASDFRTALDATLPAAVNTLFDSAAVRQSFGAAAGVAVAGLLSDAGINIGFINAAAGGMANAAVASLLADTAAQNLISSVAVEILTGTPLGEVTPMVLQSVLTDPALQWALGMAVGRGIGSLFGQGTFGTFTGEVAGAAATVIIGVGAGIARMLSGGMAADRPSATIGPLRYESASGRDHVAVVVRTPRTPVLVTYRFRLDELLPAYPAQPAPAAALS